jgi:hypothetical protein
MARQAVAGLFQYWSPAAQKLLRWPGRYRCSLGYCCCSLYWTQAMLQAGFQRRGDRHHRICGLQLRPPHLNHGASSRRRHRGIAGSRPLFDSRKAAGAGLGRGAVSGCRRQPRHVRVRRQAGCSVPFRRRMVGGQGHPRIPPRWPPSSLQGAIWRRHAVDFPPWHAMRTVFYAELVAAIGKPCAYCGAPRKAIAGRSLASTMLARSKSARCSPPPSQTTSWLRPRSR